MPMLGAALATGAGPIERAGIMVRRLILFSCANLDASLSVSILETPYPCNITYINCYYQSLLGSTLECEVPSMAYPRWGLLGS